MELHREDGHVLLLALTRTLDRLELLAARLLRRALDLCHDERVRRCRGREEEGLERTCDLIGLKRGFFSSLRPPAGCAPGQRTATGRRDRESEGRTVVAEPLVHVPPRRRPDRVLPRAHVEHPRQRRARPLARERPERVMMHERHEVDDRAALEQERATGVLALATRDVGGLAVVRVLVDDVGPVVALKGGDDAGRGRRRLGEDEGSGRERVGREAARRCERDDRVAGCDDRESARGTREEVEGEDAHNRSCSERSERAWPSAATR